MFTVLLILILASIILTIISVVRPWTVLWVAVLLLGIVEALTHLPAAH